MDLSRAKLKGRQVLNVQCKCGERMLKQGRQDI
jgi:hypothetical protein